jgi:hypothetical protein
VKTFGGNFDPVHEAVEDAVAEFSDRQASRDRSLWLKVANEIGFEAFHDLYLEQCSIMRECKLRNPAAAEKWAPYFDGANFASRIRCPVRVAVGFSDETCPPCAVYAAYNEIEVADKAIGHGIGMTHSCSQKFYSRFGDWVRFGNVK